MGDVHPVAYRNRDVPELVTRWVPPGVLGTAATLALMRGLVHRAVRDPTVQAWARQVAAGTTSLERVQAIDRWMRTAFLYTEDPRKVDGVVLEDYLIDPRIAIAQARAGQVIRGDCDDAAMLVAVLGMAVGRQATFRAVGFQGRLGPLSHVYTLLRLNGQVARLDVTRPAGLVLPAPDRILEVEV